MNGVNSACFAYGMTGAGKTYTMLGDIYRHGPGESGLCILAADLLFSKIAAESDRAHEVRVSYLEIYNEQVRDLLSDSGGAALMIVEDPIRGVVVPALTEYPIESSVGLTELILKGNERRTMAETSVNQFSSRSHAILQIALESRGRSEPAALATYTVSKLSLIDLAGSERAAGSNNHGLRLLEGAKINRSLLALGNCINILSDRAKAGAFVPYRDSKLTRLLKDSLGGNTRTVMIACISPTAACYEETINTLKYAERAKKIKKKVVRNVREAEENIVRYKEIIESLRGEISTLKDQLREKGQSRPVPEAAPTEINSIELQIKKARQVKDIVIEECGGPADSINASPEKKNVSDYLLSKYEEHCEMKQSLKELENMEKANEAQVAELQRAVEQTQKEIAADPTRKEKLESECRQKLVTLEELKANIESNRKMKESIEASLEENIKSQEKLRSLFGTLDPVQQRGVIELQIAMRTLRLQNMDLVLQNLEMKRRACIAEMEHKENVAKMHAMNAQLENMREQLRRKDAELQASRSQTRGKERGRKSGASEYSTPATRIGTAAGPTYLQISLRNRHGEPGQKTFSGLPRPAANSRSHPQPETKTKQLPIPILVNVKTLPTSGETPRKSLVQSNNKFLSKKKPSVPAGRRAEEVVLDPEPSAKAKCTGSSGRAQELDSFASLSSVAVNYEGLPSESDFLESCCVESFVRPQGKKPPEGVRARPEPIKVMINEGYYDVLKGLTETEDESKESNKDKLEKEKGPSITVTVNKQSVVGSKRCSVDRTNDSRRKNQKRRPDEHREPIIVKAVLKARPREQPSKSKGHATTSRTGKYIDGSRTRPPAGKYSETNVASALAPPTTERKDLAPTPPCTAKGASIPIPMPLVRAESLDPQEKPKRSLSLQTRFSRLRDERMERKLARGKADNSLAPIQEKLNFLFSSVSENETGMEDKKQHEHETQQQPAGNTRVPSVKIVFQQAPETRTIRGNSAEVPPRLRSSVNPGPLVSPKLPYFFTHIQCRLKIINLSQLSNVPENGANLPKQTSPFQSIRLRQRLESRQTELRRSSEAATCDINRLNEEINALIQQQKADLVRDFEVAKCSVAGPVQHRIMRAAVCSSGDVDGAEDDAAEEEVEEKMSDDSEEASASRVHPSMGIVRSGAFFTNNK